MSKRDDARLEYLAGRSYKQIAEKFGVSTATVRSWKSRYKWDDDFDDPKTVKTKKRFKQDKVSSATRCNKRSITQQNNATKVQHVATQQLIENDELNDKQKLFCIYYLQSFNTTTAYLKAYECKKSTAMVNGSSLLRKTKIKAQIKELKSQVAEEAMIELIDLVKDDAKQAFADIGDYMKFGHYEELVTNEKDMPYLDTNDNPVIAHQSWAQFKDQEDVDTSVIEEVSKGKDGAKIKLKSADKAKERLYKYLLSQKDKDGGQMDMVAKLLGTIVKGANDDGSSS
ncbi:terminase small subunit (plasmid) [Fructilactobacillus ixorae]|uniref:Terminase small subunit n=1 Tax=Fructilactobacillus ixorae TaxID=1750535 RepID=A0ABY5C5F0_9LACO|nr:terminase small subunit [Fructilactobacillus ixorae]USS93994.1 terminase small subunit [Fructilactobacillus ixorae]